MARHLRDREAAGPRLRGGLEEALCFGWVDSKRGKLDDERGSCGSRPAQARERLVAPQQGAGRAADRVGADAARGAAVIERAMADGSWSVLDGGGAARGAGGSGGGALAAPAGGRPLRRLPALGRRRP